MRNNIEEKTEIANLLDVYQKIIPILRTQDSPSLHRLVHAWESSLIQLRSLMKSNIKAKELNAMKAGLRQGLRELPKLIRTMPDVDAIALFSALETRCPSETNTDQGIALYFDQAQGTDLRRLKR